MAITQTILPYPIDDIPKPSIGMAIQYNAFSQQTEFANGRLRKRRLGIGLTYRVKMNWTFSPAEYDIFVGWWDRVLDQGTQEFSMNMSLGGYEGEWIGRFSSDPAVSTRDHFWSVSIEAVFRKAPRRTEKQFLSMLSKNYATEIVTLCALLATYYTGRWDHGIL